MKRLTMGSLFDGIGGFPLAALEYEIEPIWASEIERFPMLVTKLRFPHMQHMGDITKLNGAALPPVDIICGGSPCQDYAEEMIIPKYAAKYRLIHGFVQKLRDNKFLSVSLRV